MLFKFKIKTAVFVVAFILLSTAIFAFKPVSLKAFHTPGAYGFSDGSIIRTFQGGSCLIRHSDGSESYLAKPEVFVSEQIKKGLSYRIIEKFNVSSGGNDNVAPSSLDLVPGLYRMSNGGAIRILQSGEYLLSQPDGASICGADLRNRILQIRSNNIEMNLLSKFDSLASDKNIPQDVLKEIGASLAEASYTSQLETGVGKNAPILIPGKKDSIPETTVKVIERKTILKSGQSAGLELNYPVLVAPVPSKSEPLAGQSEPPRKSTIDGYLR